MLHGGAGAHPDATVAARRALTEAAQSRCVDIQAVREDIVPFDSPPSGINPHNRRASSINKNIWPLGESHHPRRLSNLPSVVHDNIEDDLAHILKSLEICGVSQIIVVDFTPPDAPFSVVRVIVPELEQASILRGPLGRRAIRFWESHV
jgi:YcaO-like protein with predicted kinase domain